MSPETVETVISGASPVQIIILVFLGGLFLWCLVSIVRWVIEIKIGKLPENISQIMAKISEMQLQQTRIEGKMWKREDIENEISRCIYGHIEKCPARKMYERGNDQQ